MMAAEARPLRSYRVRLVPADLPADDVQKAADAGLLPWVQLRAASSDEASHSASKVMGLRVFDAERVEGEP